MLALNLLASHLKEEKRKEENHPKGLDIVVDHTHMGRGMGGVRTGVRPSLI